MLVGYMLLDFGEGQTCILDDFFLQIGFFKMILGWPFFGYPLKWAGFIHSLLVL